MDKTQLTKTLVYSMAAATSETACSTKNRQVLTTDQHGMQMVPSQHRNTGPSIFCLPQSQGYLEGNPKGLGNLAAH